MGNRDSAACMCVGSAGSVSQAGIVCGGIVSGPSVASLRSGERGLEFSGCCRKSGGVFVQDNGRLRVGVDPKRKREIHQRRPSQGALERAAVDRQESAVLLTEQQQEYLFGESQRGADHFSRSRVGNTPLRSTSKHQSISFPLRAAPASNGFGGGADSSRLRYVLIRFPGMATIIGFGEARTPTAVANVRSSPNTSTTEFFPR